jgi:hypothetical protein
LNQTSAPKGKVGGTGVVRDQFGNVKHEFSFSGETNLSEQELRAKLNLNQENTDGSHSYNGG